ncbi:hypothetical protein A1353_21685 [Methylomonas methanica]|uniref:Uncharacterized protein n=1 Tax=Methylomonas methanica TaxID=421 RepID=A0A177M209_METMH|nr:hypothetical protein A1353_21685 [Methylomonas methanica]
MSELFRRTAEQKARLFSPRAETFRKISRPFYFAAESLRQIGSTFRLFSKISELRTELFVF